MQSKIISLSRYDADEGKVFDFKTKMSDTEEDIATRGHLYAKTLYIGPHDSIDNYIEIDAPEQEIENEN